MKDEGIVISRMENLLLYLNNKTDLLKYMPPMSPIYWPIADSNGMDRTDCAGEVYIEDDKSITVRVVKRCKPINIGLSKTITESPTTELINKTVNELVKQLMK